MTGFCYAPFPLPPVSSSPSATPGHDDRMGKRTGDRRCMARREGEDSNGQSDERSAIIASAKIGSRQDAAGGNITFRGGAQKP